MTADKGPIEAVGGSTLIGLSERPNLATAAASLRKAHGEMALVGDVGGTNARFALAPLEGPGRTTELRNWRVADFETLADAIAAYLDEASPRTRVRTGMIAVAGPANSDEVRITNYKWQFSVSQTRRDLGFDQLFVINDFAANSWGVTELGPDQLASLGGPAPIPARNGVQAAVGPGTGLGVSGLRLSNGGIDVLSSEGGHVDFAPVSEEEAEILAWLKQHHHRVSYERLLSGAGLLNIYRAIGGSEAIDTPEAVTGAKDEDPVAAHAIRIFCEVLGSFAGNVALMFGAWDGVYLAGGMLRPIRDELLASGFRHRFDDKGRFSAELVKVPTMLVEEPALGLIGAGVALRHRLAAE